MQTELMDPMLLALTLELQEKARKMNQHDSVGMQLAAGDMLDYLGSKINEHLSSKEAKQ